MKNILMNVEMTKAILNGRKVRFSEVIKENIEKATVLSKSFPYSHTDKNYKLTMVSEKEIIRKFAKYQKGETIWVREPARVILSNDERMIMRYKYLADDLHVTMNIPERFENSNWVWNCEGIPNGCIKEMARIFLKITNVRVERLQDISEEDCIKEGIRWQEPFLGMRADPCDNYPKREVFEWLWYSTSPKGYKWEDNPYVFVYEFERVDNENKIK